MRLVDFFSLITGNTSYITVIKIFDVWKCELWHTVKKKYLGTYLDLKD